MANITLKDVVEFMARGEFSPAEGRLISEAWKEGNRRRQLKATWDLRVGMKVKWESRRGFAVVGTVTRVNRATVKVTSTDGVFWTVSPSLLQKA